MKGFIDLVASMREAQKKYRDSHQLDDLKARGRWERAVDTTIADHLKLYDTPISCEWLKKNGFKDKEHFWMKNASRWCITLYSPGQNPGLLKAYRIDPLGRESSISVCVTNAGEVQDTLLAIGLSIPLKP